MGDLGGERRGDSERREERKGDHGLSVDGSESLSSERETGESGRQRERADTGDKCARE